MRLTILEIGVMDRMRAMAKLKLLGVKFERKNRDIHGNKIMQECEPTLSELYACIAKVTGMDGERSRTEGRKMLLDFARGEPTPSREPPAWKPLTVPQAMLEATARAHEYHTAGNSDVPRRTSQR